MSFLQRLLKPYSPEHLDAKSVETLAQTILSGALKHLQQICPDRKWSMTSPAESTINENVKAAIDLDYKNFISCNSDNEIDGIFALSSSLTTTLLKNILGEFLRFEFDPNSAPSLHDRLIEPILEDMIGGIFEEAGAQLRRTYNYKPAAGLLEQISDFPMGEWVKISLPLDCKHTDQAITQKATAKRKSKNRSETVAPNVSSSPIIIIIFPLNVLKEKLPHFFNMSDKIDDMPMTDKIWSERIEPIKVPLKCIVESRTMTVAECTRLQIGDVIDLPGAHHGAVKVNTQINDETVNLCSGRLGVYKNRRALSLMDTVKLNF